MKIEIKKFGTKIIVGMLIGLIFMSAIASKQGYVAEAEAAGQEITCAEGFTGPSCETPNAKTDKKKPAAEPAITCPEGFTASADGLSCGTANVPGKECPSGFIKAGSSTPEQLVCTKAPGASTGTGDMLKRMQALIWIQGALSRLIWPVLVLIGGLMDNDLLFGNGMEERLREIWIPIRNLVNILFVILLVGIALYNVLGIGGDSENSSLKSILPKIIIGIIAINFSFLAIKVFLDAVNVMTTSVFALPGQVSEGLSLIDSEGKDKETIEKLCKSLSGMSTQDFNTMTDEQLTAQDDTQIYIDAFNKMKDKYPKEFTITYPSEIKIEPGGTVSDIQEQISSISEDNPIIKTDFNKEVKAQKSGMICTGKGDLTTQGKIFLKRFNSSNAAFAMALLLGKIVYYEDLKVSGVADLEKLTFNALFSMLFYLVYTASFVALLIVLLARLVIMWISIALSPILILALASPTVKEKLGGFSKLTEQFTKMAIAPLIIALTMAIGWIMLRAIQSINMFDSQSALNLNVSIGIPVVGLSTIQDLVVAFGTIAIVWMGVFGAAEGTIAEKLTGTMKDWLQGAAKWMGTLPFRHMPFIPITVPGKNNDEPVHFTGGEVVQALSDVIHKSNEPQERLSEMLGIKRGGKEDIEDVETSGELYKHFNRKNVKEMASEEYKKDLERWTRKYPEEYEKIRNKDLKLYGYIGDLIKEGDEEERRKIAEKIKERTVVEDSDTSGTEEAAEQTTAAQGKYKPVTPESTIGGTKISDAIVAPGDSEPAMRGYDRKGEKLGEDTDKLMKSKPDGKIANEEIKKLTKALKELRIKGIAVGPTEPELRTQIGEKKVDYLLTALGGGDKGKGKPVLDEALGHAQPAGTSPAPTAPATGASSASKTDTPKELADKAASPEQQPPASA